MTHNAVDEENLKQWTRRLSQALQIVDLNLDNQLILNVADEAAAAVSPTAAPIATFMVGYAAGLAAANPTMPSNAAIARSADIVITLCQQPEDENPDASGWASTAQ